MYLPRTLYFDNACDKFIYVCDIDIFQLPHQIIGAPMEIIRIFEVIDSTWEKFRWLWKFDVFAKDSQWNQGVKTKTKSVGLFPCHKSVFVFVETSGNIMSCVVLFYFTRFLKQSVHLPCPRLLRFLPVVWQIKKCYFGTLYMYRDNCWKSHYFAISGMKLIIR